MRRSFTAISMLTAAADGSNAFAAGSDMAMTGPSIAITTAGYRFKLARPVKSAGVFETGE